MKKVVFSLITFVMFSVSVFGQIMTEKELEKYAMEKYGEKWVDAATNLASQLTLDKNNALTYVQVIPAEGKTKEQLYVMLNYWFTASFNDANSVIQLNDKDAGVIIAQGFVSGIAKHTGGMNVYNVGIRPIIKCDIKDSKVRVTYTVPYYSVIRVAGSGYFGSSQSATRINEKWILDECFPFAKKDSHKKASCKALVMANAYSNVIIDQIEECVKKGLVGNETEEW